MNTKEMIHAIVTMGLVLIGVLMLPWLVVLFELSVEKANDTYNYLTEKNEPWIWNESATKKGVIFKGSQVYLITCKTAMEVTKGDNTGSYYYSK